MAPITTEETAVIEQLREKIDADLFPDEYHKSDAFLLRFLRDQDMNISSAEASIRKYIAWRNEHGMSERIDPMNETLAKILPFRYGTYDRSGRPVCILPVGAWAVEVTTDPKNSANLVSYFFQMAERIVGEIQKVQKQGEIELAFGIVDLDTLSYKQLRKDVMSVLLKTIGELRQYYPEIFYACKLVNAPSGFSMMYKVVSAILPKRYTSKISIYGRNKNDWLPAVLENVSPDQLSKSYGGDCEDEVLLACC